MLRSRDVSEVLPQTQYWLRGCGGVFGASGTHSRRTLASVVPFRSTGCRRGHGGDSDPFSTERQRVEEIMEVIQLAAGTHSSRTVEQIVDVTVITGAELDLDADFEAVGCTCHQLAVHFFWGGHVRRDMARIWCKQAARQDRLLRSTKHVKTTTTTRRLFCSNCVASTRR